MSNQALTARIDALESRVALERLICAFERNPEPMRSASILAGRR